MKKYRVGIIGHTGRGDYGHAVDVAFRKVEGVEIYGPAPAPLAVLRGRHRHRLLIHARRQIDVQDVIRDWLGQVQWKASTRVAVDVDPYSFV